MIGLRGRYYPGMVRLSVGVEHVDDIADLEQALGALRMYF